MTREKALSIFDKDSREGWYGAEGLGKASYEITINEIYDGHEAELKAKDERIAELEARIQNMCAECECAKFADNAIKPSEMWELHTILRDTK